MSTVILLTLTGLGLAALYFLIASGLSLCSSGAWIPPPTGTRTVIGTLSAPRVRVRQRVLPVLGHMKLSEIARADVAQFITREIASNDHVGRAVVLIHHPLPAHSFATRIPQVVTVHDLAFRHHPDAYPAAGRRYHDRSARIVAAGEVSRLAA